MLGESEGSGMNTPTRHVGILGYPMYGTVLDGKFGEVPHVQRANVQFALRQGATAVTVIPYPGWDSIQPFLDAGLLVYVPRPAILPANTFRRVWRNWQAQARRRYGPGRLLLWDDAGHRRG